MTRAQIHQCAKRIFADALELPAAKRMRFVTEQSPTVAVQREVAALLACSVDAEQLLGDERLERHRLDFEQLALEPPPVPVQVGPYRIQRVLGQGGSGLVLLAQQRLPRREVAVKLLHKGRVQRASLEHEADLLGGLQHPGIARLYAAGHAVVRYADGGTVERDYLAMELVAGVSLDRYVANPVSRLDRLRLVIEICRAVHYAHQHGVLHRDLKPANILVDAEGRSRILDFGIAQWLGAAQTSVVGGTPGYMSPEQRRGDGPLTAATDVFALGGLLRRVLGSQLDRDLQAIAERAQADRAEARYESAAALAVELQRVIDRRPIEARRGGWSYHARRFAERNVALVTGASAALLALVVGFGFALNGWSSAKTQQAQAEAALQDSRNVVAFLAATLGQQQPGRTESVAGRTGMLYQAAAGMDQLEVAPIVARDLRQALGRAFADLSLYDEAIAQFEAALAVSQGEPRGARVIKAELAKLYGQMQRHTEALALLEQAIDLDDPHLEIEQQFGYLLAQLGEVEQGVALLEALIATLSEDPFVGDDAVAACRFTLGDALRVAGRYELAAWHLDAIEEAYHSDQRLRARLDEFLQARGRVRFELGEVLAAQADFHAAAVHAEESLGSGHPRHLHALGWLAVTHEALGSIEPAEALTRDVLRMREQTLGPMHPEVAITLTDLATRLLAQDRVREADQLLARAAAIRSE